MAKNLLPIFMIFAACASAPVEENEYAGIGKYYFTIEDATTNNLKEDVSIILQANRYAITDQAGQDWPYFEKFDLTENILKSDLMPPHTISHQLIKLEGNSDKVEEGDFKLAITLINENDAYSFDMIIYKWHNNDWEHMVDSGNHKIAESRYSSHEELIQAMSNTIIRFSFK